jgi:hypothetical protein
MNENDKYEILSEIDAMEKEVISDKQRTEREKNKFISQIKFGLGEEIKKNPNKVTIIKKPLTQKIKENIKKIFKYIFKMF